MTWYQEHGYAGGPCGDCRAAHLGGPPCEAPGILDTRADRDAACPVAWPSAEPTAAVWALWHLALTVDALGWPAVRDTHPLAQRLLAQPDSAEWLAEQLTRIRAALAARQRRDGTRTDEAH